MFDKIGQRCIEELLSGEVQRTHRVGSASLRSLTFELPNITHNVFHLSALIWTCRRGSGHRCPRIGPIEVYPGLSWRRSSFWQPKPTEADAKQGDLVRTLITVVVRD